MDKNIFIKLAKDVYQLTLLFPSKEPLRYKIRDAADDIIAGFIIKENDYDEKSFAEIAFIFFHDIFVPGGFFFFGTDAFQQ